MKNKKDESSTVVWMATTVDSEGGSVYDLTVCFNEIGDKNYDNKISLWVIIIY